MLTKETATKLLGVPSTAAQVEQLNSYYFGDGETQGLRVIKGTLIASSSFALSFTHNNIF